MRKSSSVRTLLIVTATGAVALGAAACGAASAGMSAGATATNTGRLVVQTAMNGILGKTVLVTPKGLTLYSLSAETGGRFICTQRSCLSVWSPLVVPRGTRATGVRLLGTIKRPDGRTQVSYRGRPLYTFKEDRKPGDAKGNGFRDVGTWLVASVGTSRPAAPPPPPNPYG